MNIFYCVNGASTARKWLGFSIDSVKRLYGETAHNLRIFVASDEPYTKEGVVWIDARPYIQEYNIAKISKVKKHHRTASPMQIFRLAAPVLKDFEPIDRILYLDIDTEVVGMGLPSLVEQDFDADVKALVEHSQHGNFSTKVMLGSAELLNLMSAHTKKRLQGGGYFNNGVMVMNLKRIRAAHPNWGRDLPMYIEMAVKHHRVVVDQDITNVIFDAVPLPPEYNVMPDTDVKIPSVKPEIIHYANMSKYRTSEYPPPKVRAKILQPKKGVP